MGKYKTLQKAKDSFLQAQYKEAMDLFAQVLQDYPNSQEAYNGVILSEMALSGDASAEALFDYYEILKEEDSQSADAIIGELLESMDNSLEQLSEIFTKPIIERLEYEDGILYEDFKKLVKQEDDNFKEIFENIMFSTKVIITKKEDFLDFLDQLIEHDFTDMAFSYIESAIKAYPNDNVLQDLLEKIATKGEVVEN